MWFHVYIFTMSNADTFVLS